MGFQKKGVEILIVTEDQGNDSFETLKNLVTTILKNTINRYQSQLITFTPVETKFGAVLSGNKWRQKRPRDRKLSEQIKNFKRFITGKLLEKELFVFWHFDGDLKWEDFNKDNQKCTIINAFSRFIAPVKDEIKRLNKPEDKILNLIPFYSIEAWLFQNSEVLKKLKSNTRDIEKIKPSQLDEIEKIKEQFTIKSKYNLQLSKKFPYNSVYALGKSFTHSVNEIKKSESLNGFIETRQNQYFQELNDNK